MNTISQDRIINIMNKFIKEKNGVHYISEAKNITIGVIGKTANIINYSQEEKYIRQDEKSLLRNITGIAEKNIIMLNQVHQDRIFVFNNPPETNKLNIADGMVTSIPELCLVIRTADCVPVFAYDNNNRIIGAAHSG